MNYSVTIAAIIIIIFTWYQTGHGQKYVEWQYVDTTFFSLNPLIELKDGRLLASMTPSVLRGPEYRKLILLNKDGELIRENILQNDSLTIEPKRIIPLNNWTKFLIIGACKSKSLPPGPFKDFFTVIVDENLESSDFNFYPVDTIGPLYNMSYYKASEDSILVAVNSSGAQFGPDSKDMYIILNGKGEIIQQYFHTSFSCLSIIPTATGYDCYSTFIKKFNKNFELVSESQVPNFYIGPTNQDYGVRISQNTILGGGINPISPNISQDADAVIYLFDNNYNVKKYAYITAPSNSLVPINVFGITPDSSVYLCNYESVGTAFASFTLAKFDMDFKKKWEIHHADDPNYRYRLWNMEATNDNGVILYGIWYRQPDWLPIAGMIKINENGNLVWTHNIPASGIRIIKSYPNPSEGIFRLNIQGITTPADLRVYDMSGRNVYVQFGMHEGETTIDLSGLPSGTYMYKVYQGSQEIGQGEWVKI